MYFFKGVFAEMMYFFKRLFGQRVYFFKRLCAAKIALFRHSAKFSTENTAYFFGKQLAESAQKLG